MIVPASTIAAGSPSGRKLQAAANWQTTFELEQSRFPQAAAFQPLLSLDRREFAKSAAVGQTDSKVAARDTAEVK